MFGRDSIKYLAPVLGGVLLLACGSDSSQEPTRADLAQTTAPQSDGTPRSGDARLDKVVSVPDTANLPKTCPCPLDSYCNLSTNTCVFGCRNNEHCSAGKYCDLTAELCKVGCRTEANCSDDGNVCTDVACKNGKCVHVPNTAKCADDGNSCTSDVCSAGQCTHPAVNEGKLCGKTLDCSDYRCKAGACVETPFKSGTSCPDDNDVCTSDTCDGKGKCAHTTVPDGTNCPNTWGGWGAKCFSGKCYPKRYACCGYSDLIYLNFSTGQTDSWDGTTACGCDNGSMWWRGTYSGYPFDFDDYCSGGCVDIGSYCLSCYDLP